MEKITWAPKIRQAKIWQIYHNDASGLVAEELVVDVASRLFERCYSVWLVTNRQVQCPRCDAILPMCESGSWKMLRGIQCCPTPSCGWETTAEEWHGSWRHRDLLGSAAVEAVETYLHAYPQARTTEALMLCIDQLIHSFHISLRTGIASRAFANNLIEGSHEEVVAFLDRLSSKASGIDKNQWRAEIEEMFRRRRGKNERSETVCICEGNAQQA